jgi:hypothetical protein
VPVVFERLAFRGRVVSFQITVLKVLAGHPEGRASLEKLRRVVAILISSGPDWTDRTKRLAARVPGLDIFTQAFVLRDKSGWQITEAGRALLASIEAPLQKTIPEEPSGAVVLLVRPRAAPPPLQPAGTKRRRVRHRRRDGRRQRLGQRHWPSGLILDQFDHKAWSLSA